MTWSVYIIRCSDQTLYTGITTNPEKRFLAHQNKKGAKYFRSHTPEAIVYVEPNHTRSSASKREAEIKKMTVEEKRLLSQLQTCSKR